MYFYKQNENGNSFQNFIRLIANFNDPLAATFYLAHTN